MDTIFQKLLLIKHCNLITLYNNLVISSVKHVLFEGLLSYYAGLSFVAFMTQINNPGILFSSIVIPFIFFIFTCGIYLVSLFIYVLGFLAKQIIRFNNPSLYSSLRFIASYRKRLIILSLLNVIIYTLMGYITPYLISYLSQNNIIFNEIENVYLLGATLGLIQGVLWNIASYFRLMRINWCKYFNEIPIDNMQTINYRALILQTPFAWLSLVLSIYLVFSNMTRAAFSSGASDNLGIYGILITIGAGLALLTLKEWFKSYPKISDKTGMFPSYRDVLNSDYYTIKYEDKETERSK